MTRRQLLKEIRRLRDVMAKMQMYLDEAKKRGYLRSPVKDPLTERFEAFEKKLDRTPTSA